MAKHLNNNTERKSQFDDFQSLLKETAQLIISNLEEDSSQTELFKLQGIMKKFEESKKRILRENKVLAELKLTLESADKPWEHDVYKMFEHNIKCMDDETAPDADNSFTTNVEDYVERLRNVCSDAVMESNEVQGAYKDPWTKLPIQDPVQSNTCKHFYERTIVYGILKKKEEFRCPYLGCVHTIKESNIIEVNV